jgi:hypothetical protein
MPKIHRIFYVKARERFMFVPIAEAKRTARRDVLRYAAASVRIARAHPTGAGWGRGIPPPSRREITGWRAILARDGRKQAGRSPAAAPGDEEADEEVVLRM